LIKEETFHVQETKKDESNIELIDSSNDQENKRIMLKEKTSLLIL